MLRVASHKLLIDSKGNARIIKAEVCLCILEHRTAGTPDTAHAHSGLHGLQRRSTQTQNPQNFLGDIRKLLIEGRGVFVYSEWFVPKRRLDSRMIT